MTKRDIDWHGIVGTRRKDTDGLGLFADPIPRMDRMAAASLRQTIHAQQKSEDGAVVATVAEAVTRVRAIAARNHHLFSTDTIARVLDDLDVPRSLESRRRYSSAVVAALRKLGARKGPMLPSGSTRRNSAQTQGWVLP